jgi:hypothetical protein
MVLKKKMGEQWAGKAGAFGFHPLAPAIGLVNRANG